MRSSVYNFDLCHWFLTADRLRTEWVVCLRKIASIFSAPLKSQHGQLTAKSSILQGSTNLSPQSITLISEDEKDLPTFKAGALQLTKVSGEGAWLSLAWKAMENLRILK